MEAGPTGCTQCHTQKKAKLTSVKKTKSEKVPRTLTLSQLEKKYEPVTFTHDMHAEMTDDCADCHHHSEAGQTPSCGECHGIPFKPDNLNMPGLKGAYHLQCMDCHKEMGSGPRGCTECHAKKVDKTKEAVEK